ncbi:mitotic checkpoint serine/threonine-protein kinase BUB1 beta [Astyanax mexicanus]|uniref:BUB1 mitotic checkpoint serine/threonine kinase B n=1 Tax=Astyanax mexicanus TaxID=7994 RepID=A0A8B9GV43_ASTMX|nr:mitotic checkpoint serine/threonine-protein kinase BUB1 beta [Astyanax mexicanus]XP_049319494.1 mitotic checkpoint serine/threonine-protein kinase BUB1 beta [Astyanax mexicanus]KAG9268157.1 mitotic checkpoint serine/threonine-protein kinase BUB1 beta [Astyanax mexicanus]
MAEGEAEWELCKENIQPLRRGRAISALHQALQQQEGSSAALNQQKQAYETELRMYDGDDPLDVWDRYIKWTEQNYPQGGKESSFSILLERVVMKFTEEKKYHNDARYVDLWIRFAEGCSDPLDVYRYMQSQGIGTMQASFYISWSEEYEKRGNSRMADTIFQDGLKCGAEPLDKLQQFHKALQARVCRQMMTSVLVQEKADEPPEPQRISLVELKAKGKKKTFAPINRVTGSVGYARGLQFSQPLGSTKNSRLMVFDENKEHFDPQEPSFESWTAPPTSRAKENEQKPDKWSNVKLPQKSRFGHTVMAPPPKANFQPFVEESDQPPAVTPCKVNPAVNTVLSARKPQREEQTPLKRLQDRQQHMQLQQEDESKTGVKSMYCKELLFSGISEFCFEELRAERYRQKCSRRLETGGDATEQPQSS